MFKRSVFVAVVLSLSAGAQIAHADLAASMLPSSRSVEVGSLATAFASIVNVSETTATDCRIDLVTTVTGDFFYQTTDPATNAPTGAPNTEVDIAPGATQTFFIGITPSEPFADQPVEFSYTCANDGPAPSIDGLNTLLFAASPFPIPDVVALAATVTNDGVVTVPDDGGLGAFAVASVNVGAQGLLDVRGRASFSLSGSVFVCETNPDGSCKAPIAESVMVDIGENATPTFSAFISSSEEIPADFANNRVFLEFLDGSSVRGSTSVAVVGGGTPAGPTAQEFFESTISPNIIQPTCAPGCHIATGTARNTRLVYLPSSDMSHLATNFTTLETFILGGNGQLLIAKPSGGTTHGGGVRLPQGSQGLADLTEFVSLVEEN